MHGWTPVVQETKQECILLLWLAHVPALTCDEMAVLHPCCLAVCRACNDKALAAGVAHPQAYSKVVRSRDTVSVAPL
jgi:hypothetical protein